MLQKSIFFQKMKLISSSTQGKIYGDVDDLDIIYNLFKDYPDEVFSKGIDDLLLTEESRFAPSIGIIKKYLDKYLYFGMSQEEFMSVMRVYKASGGMKYENKNLNMVLEKINLNKTLEEFPKTKKIVYKKAKEEV